MEFASTHKNKYVLSIITATAGVICGIMPYVIVAGIIGRLLAGNRNWEEYLVPLLFYLFCGLVEWYFMEYPPVCPIRRL